MPQKQAKGQHFIPRSEVRSSHVAGTNGARTPTMDDDERLERRHRRRRRIAIALAVVFVILLVLGGTAAFLGQRLYQSAQLVRGEAQAVLDMTDVFKDAVKTGDQERLRMVASDVNVSAHNIEAEVHAPLWDAAAMLPVVGSDIASVQTLGDVLVDLSDNALSPIVANSGDALNLKNLLNDGTVNIEALRKLITAIDEASPVIERSAETIDALPEAHMEQVRSSLDKVKDKLAKVDGALERVNAILPYLPAMLGADGQTRNYLLVALNNAELRSIGGFPGSWSVLSVTDGHISLVDAVTLQQEPDDFLEFQPDELSIMPGIAGNAGGISYLPNFTRAGMLMAQVYSYYEGTGINGTVAMDPVFLQRLLALTGGVTAPDGTVVDGTNAAWALMSDVYWRYPTSSEMQDAFFASVASLAFEKLMHGLGDIHLKDLLSTVSDSAADHRLQMWMAEPTEQAAMVALGFDSGMSSDVANPELGVFLSDNTWSKISWYAQLSTTVGDPVRNDDGTTTYAVVTTIANTATAAELYSAPRYVWGYNAAAKRSQTDMVTLPLLMAPAGGYITGVEVQGAGSLGEYSLYEHNTWFGQVNLNAGETATITYQVVVPAEATSSLTVRQTPTAQEFS